MKIFLTILAALTLAAGSGFVGALQHSLMVPIQLKKEPCKIEAKMEKMGYPKHLASAISLASSRTGLETDFLIALMQTESGFRENAISSKGYKGLMQIPHAVYEPDANILIGATIFNEKMRIAKGNLLEAICLYKGYGHGSERGIQKAREVVDLYRKLQRFEA